MIKIVKGTFGYLKNGVVVGITEKDGPISISPDRERELVELGIAEKVDRTEWEDEKEITRESLERLSMPQLREFAKQFEIKCKVGTGKNDFIQKILNCMDKETEDGEKNAENGEELPEFDPEEAVQ